MHKLLILSHVSASWLWFFAGAAVLLNMYVLSASRRGGQWRAPFEAIAAIATAVSGLLGGSVARSRAVVRRPAGLRRLITFVLRLARREFSLHYTSEQFWLRIRGR